MNRYIISSILATLSFAPALRAEVPMVVTDIPPVGALVAQVMGDLGAPQVLLTAGADPHDFQLRPSQARLLSQAGLVVWIGPELTPWLDHTLDGMASGARLGLLATPGTHLRHFSHEEAEAEEQEHAADGEGHDHDHGHSDIDPHAWLNPENAEVWLPAIAAELSRLDPEHAATYAANAQAAVLATQALDARIAAKFAPVKDRPFVTYHAAFGYLVGHYGLTQLGSVAEGDAHSPGAARLKSLRDSLGGKAVCLFPEAQHDPALLTQMADAAGARTGQPLDPEGTSIDPGPDAYAKVMEGLADTMVDCLAR
ncbi:MAG: zinc ABC transporter substrate-binding protein [Paracoccaceae bacterium]